MHKHPIKAYVYSGRCFRNVWNEISGFAALKQYIHSKWYRARQDVKKWFMLNYTILKTKRFVRKLETMDYIIQDRGTCCYPRLDLRLARKPEFEINSKEFLKECDKLDKFEDKTDNNLSVYFQSVAGETYTDEDVKDDAKARKSFYKAAKYFIDILDGKSKDVFEDDERIIEMRLSSKEVEKNA